MDIACIHCDLLLQLPEIRGGERASCPRCGHVLSSRVHDGLTRALALAFAALVLLGLSVAFPFLALESSGIESTMTLPRAAIMLSREGYTPMAVLVFGFIVIVPAVMLFTLVALLVPILRGHAVSWLVPAGRLVFGLTPWAMAEVFIIGVVVSLIKIADLATVVVGISFWAYVAFSVSFIATMASLDRLEVWTAIERCRP